jgi:hypothetical protein
MRNMGSAATNGMQKEQLRKPTQKEQWPRETLAWRRRFAPAQPAGGTLVFDARRDENVLDTRPSAGEADSGESTVAPYPLAAVREALGEPNASHAAGVVCWLFRFDSTPLHDGYTSRMWKEVRQSSNAHAEGAVNVKTHKGEAPAASLGARVGTTGVGEPSPRDAGNGVTEADPACASGYLGVTSLPERADSKAHKLRARARSSVPRGISSTLSSTYLQRGIWLRALLIANRFRVIRTVDVAVRCFPERAYKASLTAAQRAVRGLVKADLLRRYRTDRFQTVYGLTQRGVECPRRSKFEPPCRPKFEPGLEADFLMVGCA